MRFMIAQGHGHRILWFQGDGEVAALPWNGWQAWSGIRRRVSELDAKALDKAAFTAVRTRERTVLTQAQREFPPRH